jgi:hypothetical protein
MNGSEPPRTYTQEEVTEILKRALKQQSLRTETMSHDALIEMAKEVGIDREAVDAATAELAQTRADELVRHTRATELAEERAHLLGRFVGSLVTYLVVNTALYFIDRKFTGGTWFYWVLLGWGIALLLQLRGVFFPERSLERRKFHEARRAERLQRRADRHERRNRLRQAWVGGGPPAMMNEGAREFEHAVQAGVAALLSVAARKINEHADRTGVTGQQKGPARRL